MNRLIYILSVVFICVVFVFNIAAQDKTKLGELHWFSGCWETKDDAKKLLVSEQWMKPVGGMMLGVGRTVKNGKAVDFEFMRIEQKGNDVFFIAKPRANNDETPFKLIKSIGSEAVFENPEHDFPQRVMYKRQGTKLTGRIEGSNNGKFLGIDFPMTRARCE